MKFKSKKHRFFIPEVIQTSMMDCGPASLKCLLEGFGISVSYGRLREACQTDVDGTSIDSMEEVAGQLGLVVEQIMIPADHALIPEAQAMPSIAVVTIPGGNTHFVVAWNHRGPWVQIMDPGKGRSWLHADQFANMLYVHTFKVPVDEWRAWVQTDDFTLPLQVRLERLGLGNKTSRSFIEEALEDPGWHTIASLDAITRMASSLIVAKGIRKGAMAHSTLRALFDGAVADPSEQRSMCAPYQYWTARHCQPSEDGREQLNLRGAVFIRVHDKKEISFDQMADPDEDTRDEITIDTQVTQIEPGPHPKALSKELIAALQEKPTRPFWELWQLIKQGGLSTPAVLILATVLSCGGVVLELLLFRSLIDIFRDVRLLEQRIGVMSMLILFALAMLLLEFPLFAWMIKLGRDLEIRLRIAFLKTIPLLNDRYFHSRMTADMADRSHSIPWIRSFTILTNQLLRTSLTLILTTAGIIWIDPSAAVVAICALLVSVFLPLFFQPVLKERDFRIRNHNGALSVAVLDSLMGLMPIKSHSAQRTVRREYEYRLVEWVRANFSMIRAIVVTKSITLLTGTALAIILLTGYLSRTDAQRDVLLLVYWSLNISLLGASLASTAQQIPMVRNHTLRLLEPLGAPGQSQEDPLAPDMKQHPSRPPINPDGVKIQFKNISVRLSGHTILEDINLSVQPGDHVAIVGPSGAGKSSLVGLLLGWHTPATGRVLVDDEVLNERLLPRLRSQTAWVDPDVHLWNRSLLENILFGAPPESSVHLARTLEQADLRRIVENLSNGLQTSLGEGGGFVSGGEGQRVRFARGLVRGGMRLAVLDEPFRGLDREQRRRLLERAKKHWAGVTLLCVTHDVGETRIFDRVVVVSDGRIVENDKPAVLLNQKGSKYRSLLEAEYIVRKRLWEDSQWRRLWLENGLLTTSEKEAHK